MPRDAPPEPRSPPGWVAIGPKEPGHCSLMQAWRFRDLAGAGLQGCAAHAEVANPAEKIQEGSRGLRAISGLRQEVHSNRIITVNKHRSRSTGLKTLDRTHLVCKKENTEARKKKGTVRKAAGGLRREWVVGYVRRSKLCEQESKRNNCD